LRARAHTPERRARVRGAHDGRANIYMIRSSMPGGPEPVEGSFHPMRSSRSLAASGASDDAQRRSHGFGVEGGSASTFGGDVRGPHSESTRQVHLHLLARDLTLPQGTRCFTLIGHVRFMAVSPRSCVSQRRIPAQEGGI
jgi:hypothetical protein